MMKASPIVSTATTRLFRVDDHTPVERRKNTIVSRLNARGHSGRGHA